jgi:hypothetical protein
MLNTDTLAAMLLSGIATGPASVAVSTAAGLPEGDSKRRLLQMAELQLRNLFGMHAEEEDGELEAEDRFPAIAEECGGTYLGPREVAFPWGRTLRNGEWYTA